MRFEKRRLNVFAKSFDPCQPARTAQADMCRNFSLSLDFSTCRRIILRHKTDVMDAFLCDVLLSVIPQGDGLI